MNYSFKKTVTVDSDLCPGVSYVIRKITDARRTELRLDLAPILDKLSDLTAELKAVNEDDKALRAKSTQIDDLDRDLTVKKIKWATVRIEGLMLQKSEDSDEEIPGTLDNIAQWPLELRGELLGVIDAGYVMLESEAKNFGPRSTSGKVVARETPSTTAPSAEKQSTETTSVETAPAISQVA